MIYSQSYLKVLKNTGNNVSIREPDQFYSILYSDSNDDSLQVCNPSDLVQSRVFSPNDDESKWTVVAKNSTPSSNATNTIIKTFFYCRNPYRSVLAIHIDLFGKKMSDMKINGTSTAMKSSEIENWTNPLLLKNGFVVGENILTFEFKEGEPNYLFFRCKLTSI